MRIELNESNKNIIRQFTVFALILLFTYTAVIKLSDHSNFILKLLKSSLLPTESVQSLSYLIPGIEILTVLLLLFRTLWGMYLSFILMSAFSFYLVLLNMYSNYSSCSCGGMLDKLSFKAHLIFNICFVLISIAGIILYSANTPQNSKRFTLKQVQ